MGLKLTLPKQCNRLYHDFVDAYWKLADIGYSVDTVGFTFCAYPSREASQMELHDVEGNLGFGGADGVIRPELYRWAGEFPIRDIFPQGIPLDADAQKTAIYNYIKTYTNQPFEDVLET